MTNVAVKQKVVKNTKVRVSNKKEQTKKTIKEKQSRLEIFDALSKSTNLSKVKVEQVFDELKNLLSGHLKKKGSGEFIVPKIGIKIQRIKKKATKKRVMYSPIVGKDVTIEAKPARYTAKVTVLKFLEDLVE